MRRRPVVGLGRVDEDVAVLAELLAVVLADVRVVPVGAGIGEGDPVGEPAADRDRRLRLVRAVVAVLQAQAVPVDGRFEVALVDDVHDELRALGHAQRRPGDGAVVGDHPHGVVADPLGDRRDPELERVAVGEVHHLGRRRLREAGGVGREGRGRLGGVVVVVMLVVLHSYKAPLVAPAVCGAGSVLLRAGGSRSPSSWPAMKAASSATKPSSAEPRVCCQESPRK